MVMTSSTGQALQQTVRGDDSSHKDLYLTFHLAGENYALEIAHVVEIVGVQKITEVPALASYLKGVVNMRGLIIPVMDVRLRFGLAERASDNRTCLIFVCVENDTVGLLVDRVNDVAEIPAGEIEPPPATRAGHPDFIKGMGKAGDSVNILLDTRELLTFGRAIPDGIGLD
jgi:purine-binding chemotaxis protein CheW